MYPLTSRGPYEIRYSPCVWAVVFIQVEPCVCVRARANLKTCMTSKRYVTGSKETWQINWNGSNPSLFKALMCTFLGTGGRQGGEHATRINKMVVGAWYRTETNDDDNKWQESEYVSE